MFYDDKWYIDKMDKTITAKWQIEIVLSERNATSPGMLMLAAYQNWTLPLHLRLDPLFFRKSFDSTISFLHEQILSLNQYQLQLKKWVTKKSETIYLIHETVRRFGLGFRISSIQLHNSWCTYQDLDTVVYSLFFCVLKMTMHWNVTLSGKRFSLNSIFILKLQVGYLI